MKHALHRRLMWSSRWKRFREEILERDGRRCQKCGGARRLEVHHKIPRAERPDLIFEADNCLVVCRFCHQAAHRRPLPSDVVAWRDYMQENTA